MSRSPAADRLSALVAHGAFSYSFAELAREASARSARTAIARGTVTRILPDRYVAHEHRESFAARIHAATMWLPKPATVRGESALFVWGLLEQPPALCHVAVAHGTSKSTPSWLSITRGSHATAVSQWRGLEVVGPPWAIAQGFGTLPRRMRTGVVYRALHQGLTTPAAIDQALQQLPRVKKRPELIRTLEAAAQGAESYLEEQSLTRVFNTVEFSRLLRQHRIRCGKRRYRLDMYDEATRTAVELDGAEFHGRPDQRERDVRRDAELARIGILTVRLTYRDIMDRPGWCRSTIRAVVRARGTATEATISAT